MCMITTMSRPVHNYLAGDATALVGPWGLFKIITYRDLVLGAFKLCALPCSLQSRCISLYKLCLPWWLSCEKMRLILLSKLRQITCTETYVICALMLYKSYLPKINKAALYLNWVQRRPNWKIYFFGHSLTDQYTLYILASSPASRLPESSALNIVKHGMGRSKLGFKLPTSCLYLSHVTLYTYRPAHGNHESSQCLLGHTSNHTAICT